MPIKFFTIQMTNYLKISFLFFCFISNTNLNAQNESKFFIVFDDISKIFRINQTIIFKNTTNNPLNSLILNDWNSAYSTRNSKIGERFSDEFVRSFYMSYTNELAKTEIISLKINSVENLWNRNSSQIDIIEIPLQNSIKSNENITLNIQYTIKPPNTNFSRFGQYYSIYYIKNLFLSLAKLNENGQFIKYSNENLDDLLNQNINKIDAEFILPEKYTFNTNLNIDSFSTSNNFTNYQTKGFNKNDFFFALEEKSNFESFKNNKIEIVTNLADKRLNGIQKAIVIDKVLNYVSGKLGESNQEKIVVSQIDYDRNPFYGLNMLPTFVSPYPNEFLYELKFLKAYLYCYLKDNLQLDYRKDSYIFDGIQNYILIKYIEENYPNMKMLGSLTKLKFLKGYKFMQSNFNDQYLYLHLLMGRKNLDQSLITPKNDLIKFNEQISSKYKAGLVFKYLESFLQNNELEIAIKKFTEIAFKKQASKTDFETILKQSISKNIDWFFTDLINSRNTIDYTFGKVEINDKNTSIPIINKSNTNVPMPIYGLKGKEIIFKKWIENTKKDSIITFENNKIDKLVINLFNEVPEFNMRNNSKSLKGFFSLNRPIKPLFFKDIENPLYNQVFYVPEFSYNLYDGAIVSLNIHNKSFLEKPFIYDLNPSYSTKTQSFTGSGGISLNQFNRNSNWYQTRFGISGTYLHYNINAAYARITPTLNFKWRNSDFRSNERQNISLRYISVEKEKVNLQLNATNTLIDNNEPLKYSVFETRYSYQNITLAKGIGFGSNIQFASNFGKISSEIVYRKLFENNYQISTRLFAGSFLYQKTNTNFYDFGLDRPKDYLFDYNFYGRSENSGFFSQQIIIAEGGFKSKIQNPYANIWMTTLNVNSSIWHWIQAYGDAGFMKNKGQKIRFVYDSGIHLNLVPDYFEVFLPVYSSNGFELNDKKYHQKIRFNFTISPKVLIGLITRKWL